MTRHQVYYKVSELLRSADLSRDFSLFLFVKPHNNGSLICRELKWNAGVQRWEMLSYLFSHTVEGYIENNIKNLEYFGSIYQVMLSQALP